MSAPHTPGAGKRDFGKTDPEDAFRLGTFVGGLLASVIWTAGLAALVALDLIRVLP